MTHESQPEAARTQTPAGRRRGLRRGHAAPLHERKRRREAPCDGSKESQPPSGFYVEGLVGLDPQALAKARSITGLDEEIALLRLQLRELIKEEPENFRLVLQGINTLVRAVAAEYQLAGPDQQAMLRRMAEAVRQLGSLIDEE